MRDENGRLKVLFIPGTPAKGRAKEKPWRLVVGPDKPYSMGLMTITRPSGAGDPYQLWALLDIMVADYNALHANDGQAEAWEQMIRDSYVP